ncbi:MAG: DUF1800 domain-containing protein [Planctomycetaceae bacterium]
MNATSAIDPAWAWSEFVPSETSEWNLQAAAHLYRRAGFAATRQQLNEAVAAGLGAVVDAMLNDAAEPPQYAAEIESLAQAGLATGDVRKLSAWWTYRLLTTPAQLTEKLTLFWHGHFATSAAKVDDARLMLAQNNLLRQHALGDFRKLLLEISRDPAMLIYLDSASNRKAHPNENYAREIMELFSLGEGHYSENDIRELARCFTGWEIKREKFRFNRYQHDTGTKSFLGRKGEFGGEEGVAIVADQESAPLFIVGKLVSFLVFDEPVPQAELLQPLADEFRDNGMRVGPIVRRILTSRLFFSEHAIGRKVRSPVEFAVGFLRALEGSTNSVELAEAMDSLGQGLFYPPSVKGWDGGRTWINSSTLLGRSNLIHDLLTSEKTRFGKGSLADYLAAQNVTSARDVIDWFETSLFAIPIPSAARDRIAKIHQSHDGDQESRLNETVHALCSLPEFQLG